jgi:large subunit ribosomal protein L21
MKQETIFSRYAIFTTGGKQYQALEGKTVAIEKLEAKEGDSVEFDTLLIKKADGDVKIGQPHLSTSVKATIVKHMKGPKLVIFKFKRRKKSRVKRGHRQPMTIVRIDSF